MGAHIVIPKANVGKDIEPFTFGSNGTGIKFDVAVTDYQRGEEVTRWYKVACFGRVAEQAAKLIDDYKLVKGASVMVMGPFNPRDYTTRNGESRVSFDVTANVIEVLSWPKVQQQDTEPGDYGYYPGEDDDLPNF